MAVRHGPGRQDRSLDLDFPQQPFQLLEFSNLGADSCDDAGLNSVYYVGRRQYYAVSTLLGCRLGQSMEAEGMTPGTTFLEADSGYSSVMTKPSLTQMLPLFFSKCTVGVKGHRIQVEHSNRLDHVAGLARLTSQDFT